MTRYEQRQARAEKEFAQLTAKSFEEMQAEELFRSLPANSDNTRTITGRHHRIEDLNDLMIPMNTRSPLK